MKNSLKRSAFAIGALLLTGAASAQMYVGGDLSSTKVDGFSKASGAGVFAGYQINDYLGAEIAYRKIGRFDPNLGTGTVKLNMTQVSTMAALPLGDSFKVYGRLGYGFLHVGGKSSYNTDNGLIYGAGAEYAFSKHFAVRSEYTRLTSDANQFNVGLKYAF